MTKKFLLALLLLTACGQEQQGAELTATLTSPTDITLEWKGLDQQSSTLGAAGWVVEYANEPGGQYTVLQFAPLAQKTYEHPDLIPETPFYYRVRAYSGPVSDTTDVALPPGDELSEEDGHDWAPPQTLPGGPADTRPGGAPTGLKAEIKHANGIRFTWTDNASDEEGYLLEIKPAGSEDFRIAAQLDSNVNSFGLITLPDEKNATFRVRAFYFGAPSNLAHQKTGKES